MDGDIAPLAHIVELAAIYGARVVVDEAHATGMVGPDGRGAVAAAGLEGEIDVVIGTLGKALGSYGAYACAGQEMTQYLINTARPLIFSTAPGPPAVAGALAALQLLEERPHRVARLRSNARALRRALAAEGFPVGEGEMHIVPLIVGGEREAMRFCQQAIEQGVFAQAIRPPTVPAGTARLRLAAMASHTPAELERAAQTLADAARRAGLEPREMIAPAAEPEEEVPEVETALARAERLAGEADIHVRRSGAPYDFEAGDAAPPAPAEQGPFDFGGQEPPPARRVVAVSARASAPTELFDFESESTPAAPDTEPFDVERELAQAAAEAPAQAVGASGAGA